MFEYLKALKCNIIKNVVPAITLTATDSSSNLQGQKLTYSYLDIYAVNHKVVDNEELKHFDIYNQEYQKYRKEKQLEFTRHRRYIRTIQRLNYLKYINFNFGRCTALTCTISDEFIKDDNAIRVARQRLTRYLKDKGVRYFLVAKEEGDKTNRLHYHYVLFTAPYLKQSDVINRWSLGFVYMQELKGENDSVVDGAVFYVSSYLKKGLDLRFSRSWFNDGILRDDVYYLVEYDKDKKVVRLNDYSIKYFDKKPFVTKKEFQSKFVGYNVEAVQKLIKIYNLSYFSSFLYYQSKFVKFVSWIDLSKLITWFKYIEDNE